MPAVSQAQQKLMGAALAAKKGAKPISAKVGKIAKSMSKGELEKYAGTKHKGLPKKVKKESLEGAVTEMYAIRNPYSGCQAKQLVMPFDPLSGIPQDQMTPDDIRGVYYDREMADSIAEQLYEEHVQYEQMLEGKKQHVIKKLVETIKKLEEERKGCINELESQRENKIKNLGKSPEEIQQQIGDLETVKNRDIKRLKSTTIPGSFQKERIAKLTVQIDDLMATLERVQNALKGIENEKEVLKKRKK